MHVVFDQGPVSGGTEFRAPDRLIRADYLAELPAALAQLAEAQAQGCWLAGYASYEMGYGFSAKLTPLLPENRRTPLLLFGVFKKPHATTLFDAPAAPVQLSPPKPLWSRQRYRSAFDQVRDYISAGDIYQANLTFPMVARAEGRVADLYRALAVGQPVGHGALVDLGGPVLLSRSPELFFSIDRQGTINARPMKGTVSRGKTPAEDARQKQWLQTSEKNRAENLMIVDLLRNDIGRIATIGSVKVPRLFQIETYATVHQMTSQVRAQMRPQVSIAEIFRALFPCGSVTGAPKIRAMQIIAEVEAEPRDAYCGAIGWIAPDGSMAFSVTIRTLTVSKDGDVRINVGGGIVHDSTAAEEYEEALWKARFATLAPMT